MSDLQLTPRQEDAMNYVADKLWEEYEHRLMPCRRQLEAEANAYMRYYLHRAEMEGDPVEPAIGVLLHYDGAGHVTLAGVLLDVSIDKVVIEV